MRSFGEKSIKTIVIDEMVDAATFSRYSKWFLSPNLDHGEQFISFLNGLSKKYSEKFLIIPTTDRALKIILSIRSFLNDAFIIPYSENRTIIDLLDKATLICKAQEFNINIPESTIIKNRNDLNQLSPDMYFPIIVKPNIPSIQFKQCFGNKAIYIENWSAFLSIHKKLQLYNYSHSPLIIQEYIPGDMYTLYTITSYANRNSDILAYSIGHKIRQYPPKTGTIISGKIKNVPEILELSKKLIKLFNFHGISNIEFKYDYRDNKYKLMEVNPRPGVWNYSATASGVNIPSVLYEDFLGKVAVDYQNIKTEIIWLNTVVDLFDSVYFYRKNGYYSNHLNFFEWLNSIKGKKVDTLINFKDPLPFIYYLYQFFQKLFNYDKILKSQCLV